MENKYQGGSFEDFVKEEGLELEVISNPLVELEQLKNKFKVLEQAARKLRQAQRSYMANRGNQELGKQVALMAKELDVVLGDA